MDRIIKINCYEVNGDKLYVDFGNSDVIVHHKDHNITYAGKNWFDLTSGIKINDVYHLPRQSPYNTSLTKSIINNYPIRVKDFITIFHTKSHIFHRPSYKRVYKTPFMIIMFSDKEIKTKKEKSILFTLDATSYKFIEDKRNEIFVETIISE